MTPKLYKAGEVCELVQLQPYVLRSWEKEFPGIGIQKSADSPRLYRQSDLEQVQRIKQLVFGEGLTVAGARRRLEETMPVSSAASASEAKEALDALAADARSRLTVVRDGLREIHSLLSGASESTNGGNGRKADAARRGSSQKGHRSAPAASKPARVNAASAASRHKAVKRASVSTASKMKKGLKRKKI